MRRPATAAALLLLAALTAVPESPAAQHGTWPRLPDDPVAARSLLAAELAREVTPALISLVRDSRPEVRARAVLAIGRIGLPRELPRLIEASRDNDPEVRAAAAAALGMLDYDLDLGVAESARQRAAEAAETLLSDSHRAAAAAAAWSLGELGTPSPALAGLLGGGVSEDPAVLAAAADSWSVLSPEHVAPLTPLIDSPDLPVRRAAAAALAQSSDPARAPLLASLLRDPDVEVRAAALRGLAFAPLRIAAEHADGVLRLGDWSEQCAMLDWVARGWRAGDDAPDADALFTAVLRRSFDRNLHVRRCALRALGQRPRRAVAVDRLLEAIDEEEPAVRATALRALAALEPDVRGVAIDRLAARGEPAADVEVAAAVLLRSRAGSLTVDDLEELARGAPLTAAEALDELERRSPGAAWSVSRALLREGAAGRGSAPARLARLAAQQTDPLERSAAGDELWATLRDESSTALRAAALAALPRVAPGLLERRATLLPSLLDPGLRRQAFLALAGTEAAGDRVRGAADEWLAGDTDAAEAASASLPDQLMAWRESAPQLRLRTPRGEVLLQLDSTCAPLATAALWATLGSDGLSLTVWPGGSGALVPLRSDLEAVYRETCPGQVPAGSLLIRPPAAGAGGPGGPEPGWRLSLTSVPARQAAALASVLQGNRALDRLQPGDVLTLERLEQP